MTDSRIQGILNATPYSGNRMMKREREGDKDRERGRRRGENIMVLSGWRSEGRKPRRRFVWKGGTRECFHGPTGPKGEMGPGIRKHGLTTSRLTE